MGRFLTSYLVGFVLLGFFLAKPLYASRVVRVSSDQKKVVVKHYKKRKWKNGDRLCIYETNKERVACGRVVKTRKKRALVKIIFAKGEIKKGQRIRRLKRKFSMADKTALGLAREPSLIERPDLLGGGTTRGKAKTQKITFWDITAGGSLGLNHFYPYLNAQYAITMHWTVGVQPFYLSASVDEDSLSSMGCFLTANYYGFQPYRGLWVQAGAGFYSFSASTPFNDESASSFAFQATVGWRERWVYGLNLGIGAGFQYLTAPNITILDLKYKNIQAVIAAEIGFTF